MTAFILSLPWPDRKLSPNSAASWQAKLGAKAKERDDAYCQAIEQGRVELRGRLELRLICHPPDRRKHDLDNLLANTKNALDGICKALGVDDSQIDKITVERGAVTHPPKVIVALSELCA